MRLKTGRGRQEGHQLVNIKQQFLGGGWGRPRAYTHAAFPEQRYPRSQITAMAGNLATSLVRVR